MTDDDKFFERLRAGARPLRYQPDDATLARIHARVQERIAERAGIADILAAWFRPLAATLMAVAIAAAIGVTRVGADTSTAAALDAPPLEITMGGDTYRVGN